MGCKYEAIRGIEARKEHSAQLRQKARSLRDLGMSNVAIANRLGVCASTVGDWCGPVDRSRERYDPLTFGGSGSRTLAAMSVNGNE